MKRAGWIFAFVGAILLLAVAAGLFFSRGYSMTTGRCLIADNGSVMLVDGNSPIVLSNRTKNEKLFGGLSTGDKLLVLHDGIDDSYPGGTGACFVMKLSGGSRSDIPEDVLTQLQDLGWLKKAQDEAEAAVDTPEPIESFVSVTASHGYANMTLKIPEGWNYTVEEYTEESAGYEGCGINFYPAGQGTGSITLAYYDAWGVCGTGLKEETVTLGEYEAWMGTYDNHPVWDYISVKNMPGNYVFLNTGGESWWDEYGDEAMGILKNAVLAEGIRTEDEAVSLVLGNINCRCELVRASFKSQTGVWLVTVKGIDSGEEHTIALSPDGTMVQTE